MKLANINLIKVIFFLFIFAIVVGGIFFYQKILAYVLISTVFAYILNPVIHFLEKNKIPRTISIIIIYVSLTMLLTIASLYLIPQFIKQLQSFVDLGKEFISTTDFSESNIPILKSTQNYIEKLQKQFPFIDFNESMQHLVSKIGNWMGNLPSILVGYFSSLMTIFSFIITIPIIGFFLLKDQDKFKKFFLESIPNRYFELVIILLDKIDEIVGTYLRALMIEIFIVATLSAIALSIVGVKYSLLIGLFAGFANAIPYFGPVMGIVLAVISVLFTGKDVIMILYVVVAMSIVQFVDNNVVYPIVIGKNTEMHPLLIMLTVIAGGYAFGILGMFLSVPIVFLIREIIMVLHKNLKEFEII